MNSLQRGYMLLILAAFSWIIDVRKHRTVAFPLVIVGVNSIAAYIIAETSRGFIQRSLWIHLGAATLNLFGPALEPLFLGVLMVAAYWLILSWMYRNRIFIRI